MSPHVTRRHFLVQVAGAAILTPLVLRAAEQAAPARRPNMVLILADDLGYGDLGCYGAPDIRTPALDGLAAQGVRCTQFYASAPECTPTRTALLTGRYPQRVGGLECAIGLNNVGRYDDAIRLAEKHDLGLPAEETCVARMLKNAGYATALCGKWHLGYEDKFLPPRHGFDHSFGPLGGATDYWHHVESTGVNMLYQDGKPGQRDGYLTDLIAEDATACIRQQRNHRFFLYVPFTAPHSPFQDPDRKSERPITPENENKGTRELFVKMTERMDRGIGAILKTLDETGLADNTLVVFSSDNGGAGLGRNAPYAGAKSSLYEGGIRVPFIARWPGVLPKGLVTDHIGTTLDLTASLLRAGGATPPAGRTLDGVDMLAEIAEKQSPKPRPLFWRYRRGARTLKAVRNGALKYMCVAEAKGTTEFLFDVIADPQEKDNLLSQQGDSVDRLKKLLAEWERDVKHAR